MKLVFLVLNVNDEPISKFQFFFNNMLEDFDDLEEEVKAKEKRKRNPNLKKQRRN